MEIADSALKTDYGFWRFLNVCSEPFVANLSLFLNDRFQS